MKLINNATGDVTKAYRVLSGDNSYNFFQVDFNGGSGTVTIQGRVHESLPWINLKEFTENGMALVATPLFIRVAATYSGSDLIVGADLAGVEI